MESNVPSRERLFMVLVDDCLLTAGGRVRLSENEQLLICVLAKLQRNEPDRYFTARQIVEAIPSRFYYEQPWTEDDVHFLASSLCQEELVASLFSIVSSDAGFTYRLAMESPHIIIHRNRFDFSDTRLHSRWDN